MSEDKKLAAICGLDCEACSVYIGTTEEPDRLKRIAENFDQSVEDMKCSGCRSGNRSFFCRTCDFKDCSEEKGIEFCGECDDFPCEDFRTFQKARPHRIEIYEDMKTISEKGWDEWLKEKRKEYSCPECGTINSAYDITCRKCGNEPSNLYVQKHKIRIIEVLKDK